MMKEEKEEDVISLADYRARKETAELYEEVLAFAVCQGEISISSIQRKFAVGYHTAKDIMDRMEKEGLVGPF